MAYIEITIHGNSADEIRRKAALIAAWKSRQYSFMHAVNREAAIAWRYHLPAYEWRAAEPGKSGTEIAEETPHWHQYKVENIQHWSLTEIQDGAYTIEPGNPGAPPTRIPPKEGIRK